MALPVSADGEPTSASRIRPSSESSTMCHHSKLNGTAFGIHDWLNYLWDQAAMCRKLVEHADDPFKDDAGAGRLRDTGLATFRAVERVAAFDMDFCLVMGASEVC